MFIKGYTTSLWSLFHLYITQRQKTDAKRIQDKAWLVEKVIDWELSKKFKSDPADEW